MTVAWAVLIVMGVATGLAVHRLWQFRSELERLADELTLDVGPESTLLYDKDNNLISALFEEHRIAVRLEEMSPHLVNAVLVTEDRRFYDHDGIDIRRILAAAVANQKAGEIVEGGSTITQQLVRSILLTREQTYSRKVKEAILARRIEERYAKQAILEAYLNRVYFGDGYYGVQAAAIGYFGKQVSELDVVEAATLAGLIKGPSIYAPTKNPEACKKRRDIVLDEMRAVGLLDDHEFQQAVSVPVKALLARGDQTGVADPRHAHGAEYFRDAVSRELTERFGADAVYTGGLRVYTTLDRDLQRLAENVIASRLRGLSRGPEPLQGALVAIEPQTGYVKALVGGRSFKESPFNRAIDARRQPGSAFKPFVYAAALETGFSPGSMIEGLDQPIPTEQGPWLPNGEHETSATTLRTGLALSSNRAAAHLMQDVGIHRTLDLVQRVGIHSPMPAVPSLALGSGELTLYELTSAYSVFANRGIWKQPTMIRRVVDRYGREIYSAEQHERRALSETTAYMMASMMSDVIDYGTGASARSAGFKLQAAGKTGTSQDYSDAWFVGFTPSMATGVWFGYDKPRPIMNRGFASVVAVPAWARFMVAAMRGVKDSWFELPGGLAEVKICRLSGMLATDKCHLPVYEPPEYDINNPGIVRASGTMRESGVVTDIRQADRIPPPCTMPHGEPAPAMPPSYYDPSFVNPDVQRTIGTDLGTAPAVPAAPPYISPDPSRPVTPPPAWMTERNTPPRVTTIVPAAPADAKPVVTPAVAPAPAPVPVPAPAPVPAPTVVPPVAPPAVEKPKPAEAEKAKPAEGEKPKAAETPNPIIPNVERTPTQPEQPPQDPVIPGSRVEKAPPRAPGNGTPRVPGF
jgi:penicillin-binding protein 1A